MRVGHALGAVRPVGQRRGGRACAGRLVTAPRRPGAAGDSAAACADGGNPRGPHQGSRQRRRMSLLAGRAAVPVALRGRPRPARARRSWPTSTSTPRKSRRCSTGSRPRSGCASTSLRTRSARRDVVRRLGDAGPHVYRPDARSTATSRPVIAPCGTTRTHAASTSGCTRAVISCPSSRGWWTAG